MVAATRAVLCVSIRLFVQGAGMHAMGRAKVSLQMLNVFDRQLQNTPSC